MADMYRKRPIEVEAMQWDGANGAEVVAWVGVTPRTDPFPAAAEWPEHGTLRFAVDKGGGTATIHPGDWVIRERDGVGFYPCVAAEFESTYEPAPVVELDKEQQDG